MNGFTQIRTCRLVASLIALLGAFCLLVQRIAVSVLAMAGEAVQMGFKRYDSFTGRMALNNFEEDRQLFACMKNAEEILSNAEFWVYALLIVSIVLFAVALFGLIFPKLFGRVLVGLKLLKPVALSERRDDDAYEDDVEFAEDAENADYDDEGEYVACEFGEVQESECVLGSFFCKMKSKMRKMLKRLPWLGWALIGAVLLVVLGIAFGIRGCSEHHAEQMKKSASEELFEQSLTYVNAQKAYFNQNTAVGGPKSLKLPDSLSTEFFTYKVTKSRFAAKLNVAVGDCPAGTEWRINSSTNGIFFVDLILSRIPPKDTNCVKLLPDFKNIGRKLPKK